MPGLIKSDITIIGAGPAGITAALALSKKGIPCLLIDKHRFPREKICGDGLSGKVISILNRIDPGYAPELAASGLATDSHAVRFYSPRLKMMELSFNKDSIASPSGFICKRNDFDNFLLNKALEIQSIKFKDRIHINKLSRNNGLIILEDKEGKSIAETRLILFAAGADRNLIRQLDPSYPGSAEEGLGIRGYFENVTGSDRKHAIEIHFLKELLPWYLWIFPFSDGSANVGLALPESLAKKNPLSLKELLFYLIEKYPHLKSRFINAKLNGKTEANRLPYYTGPCPVAGDNYLLLGDAARLVDPFTGEGIGNAMASGYLAAETATQCMTDNNFSFSSTQIYQWKINKKLVPELSLSLKLQGLARRPTLLNLVIGRASRNENTRNLLAEMLYSTDAKRKLNKPVFYLKLLLGL
jgi:geranylgeranyl reductase family protein